MANRPAIAKRNLSPTEEVILSTSSETWGFRRRRLLAQRAEQREGVRVAEAVATASAETPTMAVSQSPTTVPEPGLPSVVHPATHRLLTVDQDQRQAPRVSGQVGLACFPSDALVLFDWIGLEAYHQAGLEFGKSRTTATAAPGAGTSTTVSASPAISTPTSDAMETAASATSRISMADPSNALDGEETRPPSAMQLNSSDCVCGRGREIRDGSIGASESGANDILGRCLEFER